VHKSSKVHVMFFYLLIDALCAAVSFLFAYFSKYAHVAVWQDRHASEYAAVLLLWFTMFVLLNLRKSLYETNRMSSLAGEARGVLSSAVLAAVGAAVSVFFFKFDFFSRRIFVYSSAALFVLCAFWRFVKRLVVRHLVAHGYNNFNVLIVGTGNEADEVLDEIRSNPYLGLRVKGFLAESGVKEYEGFPVLGSYADLEKVVLASFVDEIIVASSLNRELIRHILACADKLKRNVRVMADSYGLAPRDIDVVQLGVLQMFSYRHAHAGSAQSSVKRFFDVFATLLGVVCASPILIAIALLIKLDSKGPVLYVSKRAGYKGRVFDFYKFRTMIVDADTQKQTLMSQNEVKGGKIFKIKNDPRLTRIGGFLRKYSLDELPQVINVLKGDMSLVGPRPFPVEEFHSFDPFHKARAEAKPGITGIAQVKGRSDLSFEHWMKWDIWYVDNWSLWLDFLVLLWTFPAVVKGKGAY